MRKSKIYKQHLRTGVPQSVFEDLTPEAWRAIGTLADMVDSRHAFGDDPTLLDIAVMNGSDGVAGLIEEATEAHPELTIGYARTISGINYKTLVRTANPTVAFRNANEGTATDKGVYENRLVETFILDPQWQVDQAVADRHEDGAAALIALEASAILEGAMQTLASQFYYGTDSDSKGFPGLVSAYDSSNMQVKAGGSTADSQSSCWGVRFGAKDVGWVWGNGGQLEVSDATLERVLDGSSNPYWAYCQHLTAYPGLQVCSVNSAGRICNINEDDDSKPLTDAYIADLLALFPVGKLPSVLFMNRKVLAGLRGSRTATNPTGAPAPFPTEAFGIPIYVTDAITNTEAVVS